VHLGFLKDLRRLVEDSHHIQDLRENDSLCVVFFLSDPAAPSERIKHLLRVLTSSPCMSLVRGGERIFLKGQEEFLEEPSMRFHEEVLY
jgi:cell pole-organizing protein PopZ